MTMPTRRQGRSEARERLLSTASGLFYNEGLRAVGVDRIVAEAQVTRATFYRHFPSKDDLIVAYLRGADDAVRAEFRIAEEDSSSPAGALRAIGSAIAASLARPGFRGCAFLNASAEFPDPDGVVHRVVVEHRAWLLGRLTELFTEVDDTTDVAAGAPRPDHAARHFLMLRDGTMSAARLDGAEEVGATFLRGVNGLLTVIHSPSHKSGAEGPPYLPPATTASAER